MRCGFPIPGKPSWKKAAGYLASQLTEPREGHQAVQSHQDQGAHGERQKQLCNSALSSAGLESGSWFKVWMVFRAHAVVAFRITTVCT